MSVQSGEAHRIHVSPTHSSPGHTGKKTAGFIVISELLIISSILVIGLIIGIVVIRNSMNSEMSDVAQAIGNLDQSYAFSGIATGNGSAVVAGSAFFDERDDQASDHGNWVFVPAVPGE